MHGYVSQCSFWNEAAREADGDWLWIMADDVIVSGQWLAFIENEKRRDVIIQPEINRLVESIYPKDPTCPFMFIHRTAWENELGRQFSQPIDDDIWERLRKRHGWETEFIPGLIAWHQQDPPDALRQYHQT